MLKGPDLSVAGNVNNHVLESKEICLFHLINLNGIKLTIKPQILRTCTWQIYLQSYIEGFHDFKCNVNDKCDRILECGVVLDLSILHVFFVSNGCDFCIPSDLFSFCFHKSEISQGNVPIFFNPYWPPLNWLGIKIRNYNWKIMASFAVHFMQKKKATVLLQQLLVSFCWVQ